MEPAMEYAIQFNGNVVECQGLPSNLSETDQTCQKRTEQGVSWLRQGTSLCAAWFRPWFSKYRSISEYILSTSPLSQFSKACIYLAWLGDGSRYSSFHFYQHPSPNLLFVIKLANNYLLPQGSSQVPAQWDRQCVGLDLESGNQGLTSMATKWSWASHFTSLIPVTPCQVVGGYNNRMCISLHFAMPHTSTYIIVVGAHCKM